MPIVTLSRGFPAGCRAVAEAVAASLGCPCVGREILVEAAAKLGVSADLLGIKEEASDFWSQLTLARQRYMVGVQAALAERALTGELVYESYTGHLLLRELPFVLRVRIVAPLQMRIREAMQSENLTRHVAEASVRRYDQVRGRWTRTIYDVDWSDPSLYDLVLNLEQLSVTDAADCIVRMARTPRFAMDPGVRTRLEDFVLVTRTRLALERSPATHGLATNVTALNGELTVNVVALEAAMPGRLPEVFRQEVMAVLTSVEGVQKLNLNIEPRGSLL